MVFKPICCVCGQEIRPYHLFYRPAPGSTSASPAARRKTPKRRRELPTRTDYCGRGIDQVGRQWAGASCPSAELCPRERSLLSRKEHSRILPIRFKDSCHFRSHLCHYSDFAFDLWVQYESRCAKIGHFPDLIADPGANSRKI